VRSPRCLTHPRVGNTARSALAGQGAAAVAAAPRALPASPCSSGAPHLLQPPSRAIKVAAFAVCLCCCPPRHKSLVLSFVVKTQGVGRGASPGPVGLDRGGPGVWRHWRPFFARQPKDSLPPPRLSFSAVGLPKAGINQSPVHGGPRFWFVLAAPCRSCS
jgi:hypothetical protein